MDTGEVSLFYVNFFLCGIYQHHACMNKYCTFRPHGEGWSTTAMEKQSTFLAIV